MCVCVCAYAHRGTFALLGDMEADCFKETKSTKVQKELKHNSGANTRERDVLCVHDKEDDDSVL